MISEILEVYNQASKFDRQGRNWYRNAHTECEYLACKYNLSVEVVCGIVAALSPRLKWEENIEAAERVITGKSEGIRALKTNVRKAESILKTGEVKMGGPKVNNFYLNLLNPEDGESVTIDTWAARIALGDWQWKKTVNEKLYWQLADEYRAAAAEVGMLPSELQAITWESIRRRAKAGKAQIALDI